MCGPGLWSGHWIPASGLLKAEWTLNTVCSLQPLSSEEISQQLRQSRGADHSQRSKKSPGSYPPQSRKTTPLMMCLSCLWFQPDQKQIKSHRNQEQQHSQWQFLAGLHPSVSLKTSTVGLQREALNNMIKKRDLKKTWLQFFFCSQIWGTCRQVIDRADQSKCRAGRRLRSSHPGHRGKTTDAVKASKQGGSGCLHSEEGGVRVGVRVRILLDCGGGGMLQQRESGGGLSTSPRPRCCFFWESLLSRPWISESSSASKRLSSETRLAWSSRPVMELEGQN